MKRKIISFLLVLCTLLPMCTHVIAASYEDQKNEVKDKLNEASDQKDKVQSEKKTTLEEISDLEDSIAKYETELAALKEDIAKLEKTIKTKNEEIRVLQEEYEERQQLLTDRLVAIYKEGQPTFLDVLLSSDSVSDYIAGTAMVQQLAKADTRQIEEVEEKRMKVEKAKAELEEQKTKLDIAKKSVETKQGQLKVAKSSKETKVATLSAKEKELQKEIEKYNAEIKRIDEEIRKQAEQSKDIYNGSFSGKLIWPLSSNSKNYNVITSTFGPRRSPVAGASSNHRGIDMGVSIGTPVYASADGYVVSVMQTGARGKFILIKHADDLYTRYQHLNSYVVSAGQYVKQSQIIGYSGNTGIGSGPHLHYEVLKTPYYMTEINPLTCGLVALPPLIYS